MDKKKEPSPLSIVWQWAKEEHKEFYAAIVLAFIGVAGTMTAYFGMAALIRLLLSGGEKQRISIARAMLKDAPIIILDEATASVDPENEAELQKAIDALTHDKTIIMIAHRLKTVRNADQILVLSGGHIVQQGTHEKLVAEPGIYADFLRTREEAAGWKLA